MNNMKIVVLIVSMVTIDRAQVVGWPPVRSYRKNVMAVQKSTTEEKSEKSAVTGNSMISTAAAFVKVSMDGAPYLRKVDLKVYKSYQELSDALAKMFSSFTMSESSLLDQYSLHLIYFVPKQIIYILSN